MSSLDLTDEPTIYRRDCPHHATVTIKIDIRKINKDGSLDSEVMGNHLLQKYGISTKAQFHVSGKDEPDCINTLKEKLETLNG